MKLTVSFSLIFFIDLVWCSMNVFAQDINTPRIMNVTTLADVPDQKTDSASFSALKGELVVLSLTSADMFDHFERDVERLKEKYDGGKLIIAVDRDGTSEKSEFIIDFYRRSLDKVNEKNFYRIAFDEALKNIVAKYGEVRFKAVMYDLTERKKE